MKLLYSSTYRKSLKNVLEYSVDTFGKRVTNEFNSEINQKISLLFTLPNAYARCRFLDSTKTKTYRNIVARSYLIIYSVTPEQIIIIDIIHGSINPLAMKNRIST